MSTLKALSQLITVNDICEPFLGEFDSSQRVESFEKEWMELCCDKNHAPWEPVALVKHNRKIVGWVGFDSLSDAKTVFEGMEPINGDILISSDTPLFEAIHTVCSKNNSIYLVLKGNRFLGFLDYSHFNKIPFRMCLFALLIDLESMMLKITQSDPSVMSSL